VLSLPLPEIVRLLRNPPPSVTAAAEHLVYTSIYAVSLGVEGQIATPWTFMRFPGRRHPFYRVSIPTRYAADCAPEGCAMVVAETSHHPTRHRLDPEQAARDARRGLVELGLLRRGERVVAERVHDIRHGHVVYDHRTRESVRVVLDHLRSRSIHTCGKYGLWKDMLMTGAILTGVETAARIADAVDEDQKKRSSSATV
jgi:UDP-galactopyranose mutase